MNRPASSSTAFAPNGPKWPLVRVVKVAEKHAKRAKNQIPQECYRKAIDSLLKTVYVIRKLFWAKRRSWK